VVKLPNNLASDDEQAVKIDKSDAPRALFSSTERSDTHTIRDLYEAA
jgi:hypothetical protein